MESSAQGPQAGEVPLAPALFFTADSAGVRFSQEDDSSVSHGPVTVAVGIGFPWDPRRAPPAV
jgi:hypothetical protein